MPMDPRSAGISMTPSNAPAYGAQIEALYNAALDLSRRIDAIESAPFKVDQLDGAKLKPSSVDTAQINAGAIHTAQLEAGSILASIANIGAVNATHIDATSIRASILAVSKITAADIQANTITSGQIDASSIRASVLDAAVLTVNNAYIQSLRASLLNVSSVIATNVNTAVLTAVSAAVGNLGAISANLGTVTLSTGGILRTDVSPNKRVELDALGIRMYNSSNQLTLGMDPTTGVAQFGGVVTTGAQVPASTLTGFVGGGNLVLNSSWESTDPAMPGALWTNNGTTDSVVTTQAFHGSKALRVNYAAGTNPRVDSDLVAKHGVPITSMRSRPMVTSVWVWVDTTATTLAAGVTDAALSVFDGTTQPSVAASSLTKGQWNRISVKHTPPAGATAVTIRLWNPYTNGPIFFDGLQTEFGDAMTAYNPKADEIIYGSITALHIAAGTITGTEISATAIDGKTITGALFQNVATDPAVRFDSTGFYITEAGGAHAVDVKPTGFQLATPTTPVTLAARSLNWVRPTDSWTDFQITDYSTITTGAGQATVQKIAKSTDGGAGAATLALLSKSVSAVNNPTDVAGILLESMRSSTAGTLIRLITQTASAASLTKVLFDAAGASDFLQLLTTSKRTMNTGASSATYTASNISGVTTIAHGLGVTPTTVQISTKAPNNVRTVWSESAAADATNIYIQGYNATGASVSLSQGFYWLAIG